MHRTKLLLFPFFMASIASVQAGSAPVIVGFERFVGTPALPEVEAGRLLMRELNCHSCHAAEVKPSEPSAKVAPHLDDVGDRVHPAFLRKFLTSPGTVKPGTTMPNVFDGEAEESRSQKVEALVHFLSARSSTGLVVVGPEAAAVERGNALFHRVGCAVCHGSRRDNAPNLATSIPLGPIEEKYTIDSLRRFLLDPLHSRPSGRMPPLNLKEDEARDIASYLLRDIKVEPNLKYMVYEGHFENLPDFSKLTPKKAGETAGFNLGLAGRKSDFAMRFFGYLHVPANGNYMFHVSSDDGARLLIDDQVVVNNDGIHPMTEKSARAALAAGSHRVELQYFQGGGEWEVRVEMGDKAKSLIPLGTTLTLGPTPPRKADGWKIEPSLAAKGKNLFLSEGCARCHQVKVEGQRLAAAIKAPRMKEIQATSAGCLAEKPPANVPNFRLDERQRRALRAALADTGAPSLEPTPTIQRTMMTFNCYACHQRSDIGGVEQARDSLFQTTQQEMGDEGRIPPRLDGVGAKLTESYLREIFDKGADARPYMLTRMPRFGRSNVDHLVRDFKDADLKAGALANMEPIDFGEPLPYVKSTGRHLVGDQAFSCIKCHGFGNHAATGIQAMDLTKMTHRLREDWFVNYLRDPQVYRPGTRMPSSWPKKGKSVLFTIMKGDVEKQIRSIWTYLQDGTRAALPTGLVRDQIELKPTTEPIIYRNFVEGVGPRAIAVGYPEKISLGFDAENVRLAAVWHNAFIAATKGWNDRGAGFEMPLGDHLVTWPNESPFAKLSAAGEPWPAAPARELGVRFKGYHLDDQRRPTFRYSLAGIAVKDQFTPKTGGRFPIFNRTLAFESQAKGWWMRIGSGKSVEAIGSDSFVVDQILKLTVHQAPGPVEIQKRMGRTDLLIPCFGKEGEGKPVIAFSIDW